MAEYAPEGIVFASNQTGWIDYNDVYGNIYPDNEIRGFSKNQIETMDLLSEGPVKGPLTGYYIFSGVKGEIGWRTAIFTGYKLVDITGVEYLRSIYWNEIPVLNEYGLFNFQSIDVSYSIGHPNGEVLQTLSPYQTVSRTIGERLFAGAEAAKYYRILNKDCRGAVINIKIPSLSDTNVENGDIKRTIVEYKMSYRPLFENSESNEFLGLKTEKIFGKLTNSQYIRSTRIDFLTNVWTNTDFIGWEIKIERVTDDATDSFLRNQTYVDSITEIQGNIYTFPNSAMVRSLFDAEYFQSVPDRAHEIEGIKIKIPGNYNPILRTYSGEGFATSNSGWNGEFATGVYYTNNPAWCFYDILTNKRYGLGRYIDPSYIDKWSLYTIGKYCDELVSDGYGGLEPRFECNLWLTTREEAYKVVQDMSSIFRGLAYYANGSIVAVQDAQKNPITSFTNANVEEGNFNYSTTSKRARHSIAIVRYNDPKNFYRPSIEYVEDFDAIRNYGIKEVEVTSFGTTSRGQAIRLGRWILASDNLETENVNFVAGLEAAYLRPGDVFMVFDSNRKSKRYGGRAINIKNVDNTGTNVILDYKTDFESTIEYKISFVTPSYNYNPSNITGLDSSDVSGIRRSFIQSYLFSGWQASNSGNYTNLDIFTGFDFNSYFTSGKPIWIVELSDKYINYTGSRYFTSNQYDYYRVININETETNKFEIDGLQYNPNKFIEIESGLSFSKSISESNIEIPATPYNLNFYVYNV